MGRNYTHLKPTASRVLQAPASSPNLKLVAGMRLIMVFAGSGNLCPGCQSRPAPSAAGIARELHTSTARSPVQSLRPAAKPPEHRGCVSPLRSSSAARRWVGAAIQPPRLPGWRRRGGSAHIESSWRRKLPALQKQRHSAAHSQGGQLHTQLAAARAAGSAPATCPAAPSRGALDPGTPCCLHPARKP
jgi:hypothetical protein